MKLVNAFLFVIAAVLSVPAIAAQNNDMEILRDKIKADKKLVVAANMSLTESEAKAFWPVYEAYQNDLMQLNKRLINVIKEYADAYNKDAVTDALAKKLINESVAIKEAEAKLMRSYVPKLEKVLAGVKMARYIQIENKIRAVVDYELAANIPLVK
ncbi:MAG: hypothetical protein OEW79_07850 [Betaproteobacteria bacterium]|jgi:GTPase Era involved in 16S rRNA processing|nr:hypothetical protein [Betaproteobacteria bacterium]MDH5342729.1 hypothetical protein [Betaproteobacteria bacterium]